MQLNRHFLLRCFSPLEPFINSLNRVGGVAMWEGNRSDTKGGWIFMQRLKLQLGGEGEGKGRGWIFVLNLTKG